MLSDEQLHILIHTLPGPAHARAIDTGKYFMANQDHATNHGFETVESALNITCEDVSHHRLQKIESLEGSLVLEKSHKQTIEQLNYRAETEKKPVSGHICTLFPTGFVLNGFLRKIPIYGLLEKVVGILTFFEDQTETLGLLQLYRLYKKHYPKHKATIQFLKYLNVKQHFDKLPTEQEMTILIMLRGNPASKHPARSLNISYRTVEEYKSRLRQKLPNVSLEHLLVSLRMRQAQAFSIAETDPIL